MCPDIPQPQTVPLASNWFAQPTPKAFSRGGPLPGVNAVPDGALQWLWRYFR